MCALTNALFIAIWTVHFWTEVLCKYKGVHSVYVRQ